MQLDTNLLVSKAEAQTFRYDASQNAERRRREGRSTQNSFSRDLRMISFTVGAGADAAK